MLNALKDFIKKHALFNLSSDKILLAVSGGVDSIVMLDLFHHLNINYGIGHCNFHLRGEASDQDEQFVKVLAEKYEADSWFTDFDTVEYARHRKISIEMAARDLRYEWLYKILHHNEFDFIATAHHQGDVLETVIFNLSKGTGIAGLQGIKPKRDKIIRPLWFASRQEIEQYAMTNQLDWRTDESNLSEEYTRNLIRHKVVPVLKQINPNLHHTFQLSLEKLNAVAAIFYQKVESFIKKGVSCHSDQVIIDKDILIQTTEPVIILAEVLKDYNFNYVQAKQIAESINSQPGKIFLSHSHELILDRTQLFISERKHEKDEIYNINPETDALKAGKIHFKIKKIAASDFHLKKDTTIASLDYDKLAFPLVIRHWKKGDRFIPLGMKGQKKLSDFMIDEKIPLNLKKRIFVVESGGKIVWVVGYRIDERFKVTENTKDIFQISIKA